jgi:cell division protein ZapA (FtsZ GTPase activity inhibitor)
MAEKIKVRIRGKEYTLKGENELLVQKAAEEVNKEAKQFEGIHLNKPDETIAILAALNIAEKKAILEKQKTIDENFLVTELERMAKSLDESISKSDIL